MTTNPSPPTDAPEPAPTHSADRWELPTEPEPGTVVQGRNYVWARREGDGGWRRTGSGQTFGWTTVLADAPLTRLVPADRATDAEREDTVDRLIRVNDALRTELVRLRDVTDGPDPDRAERRRKALRSRVVYEARRLLDAVDGGRPADDVDGPIVNLRTALAKLDAATDMRTH